MYNENGTERRRRAACALAATILTPPQEALSGVCVRASQLAIYGELCRQTHTRIHACDRGHGARRADRVSLSVTRHACQSAAHRCQEGA